MTLVGCMVWCHVMSWGYLPTSGNYEQYLELKTAKLAGEEAAMADDLKKLQRELQWMRKQPKARQAKSKARQEAYRELVKKTEGGKREATNLELKGSESTARLGQSILVFDGASLR